MKKKIHWVSEFKLYDDIGQHNQNLFKIQGTTSFVNHANMSAPPAQPRNNTQLITEPNVTQPAADNIMKS